ncbi:hypothetical protein ACFXPX_13860 [Kitasatospora sp. NPDC059146]|uniref:hypothetical protein n=1 Tax=Kitasatospora sp. NPDC059146 TaxID=3346741 RepID=UPI0036A83A99
MIVAAVLIGGLATTMLESNGQNEKAAPQNHHPALAATLAAAPGMGSNIPSYAYPDKPSVPLQNQPVSAFCTDTRIFPQSGGRQDEDAKAALVRLRGTDDFRLVPLASVQLQEGSSTAEAQLPACGPADYTFWGINVRELVLRLI